MSVNNSFVFYCNWGVYSAGEKLYIDSVHLLYLMNIKSRGYKVLLITKESSELDKKVELPSDIEVVLLPEFKGYINGFSILSKLLSTVRKLSKESARYYIRYPEPFAWIFLLNSHKGSEVGLHLMSNPIKAILGRKSMFKYFKLMLFIPTFLFSITIANLVRNVTLSCNGKGLRDELKLSNYSQCLVLDESTLGKKDFFFKERADTYQPVELLYVGYLREAKGIQYLLYSLKKLVDKSNHQYHLNLVGDGDYRGQLENLVEELAIQKNVSFLGYKPYGDELLDLYRNSNIFILPSLTEGSPRVIIEAMANSLPVISTKVGNIPFMLSNNKGICIEPKRADLLSQSIESLVANEGLRTSVVKNAYAFSENFTINNFFDRFLSKSNDFYDRA